MQHFSHTHIPDTRRTKLDDKCTSYILNGVSEESRGCRLYDPTKKKVIISKDVVVERKKHGTGTVNPVNRLVQD